MIAQSKENANDTWDFRLTINDFRSGCYFSLVSHPLMEHEALQATLSQTETDSLTKRNIFGLFCVFKVQDYEMK